MRPTLLIAAMMALGCEPKAGDPQDGTAGSDALTMTDATGSGGMSATTETTGANTPTSSDSGPTTTEDSPSTTTGNNSSMCRPFCDKWVACGIDEMSEPCPCPAELDPVCSQEWKLTVECFLFDTCESLESGMSPCWKDFASAAICGDDTCEVAQEFGDDVPLDGCAFLQECAEAPSRRLVCDHGQCECEIDGMPVVMGICTPANACDPALAAEHIDNCCA